MPEILQNVVLSRNPCPICLDANGRQMTYDEWAASEWGLPGSSVRYCEDDCHCILVPLEAMPHLPEISKQAALRGETGSELLQIVELGPEEEGLKEIMDLWNEEIGKLPDEIYDMDVYEVEAYLRQEYRKIRRGD